MHPEMARALAEQHKHELIQRSESRHAAASLRGPRRPARRWRAPRYRVHWSRTGRRERAWLIVISASRGL